MKIDVAHFASVTGPLKLSSPLEVQKQGVTEPGQLVVVRALTENPFYPDIELVSGERVRIRKGDVIAGLVIVLINLVGGTAIGVLQNGMTAAEAASTYALISIGDGLVSQIPSLCIAVAGAKWATSIFMRAHSAVSWPALRRGPARSPRPRSSIGPRPAA